MGRAITSLPSVRLVAVRFPVVVWAKSAVSTWNTTTGFYSVIEIHTWLSFSRRSRIRQLDYYIFSSSGNPNPPHQLQTHHPNILLLASYSTTVITYKTARLEHGAIFYDGVLVGSGNQCDLIEQVALERFYVAKDLDARTLRQT